MSFKKSTMRLSWMLLGALVISPGLFNFRPPDLVEFQMSQFRKSA